MGDKSLALSIKQPWATLVAHGQKTVEVRGWATERRGTVLIHASRRSDSRPEAWARLPDELAREARRMGGIIGVADLVDCLIYDAGTFARDRERHFNDPRWFARPMLYGFVFANARTLPFRPYRGSVRFFPVLSESLLESSFALDESMELYANRMDVDGRITGQCPVAAGG